MDDNFDDYFTDDHVPEENKANHQETEQEREEREIKEATIERRGNTKILVTKIEPDSNLIKSNPYKQESAEPAAK